MASSLLALIDDIATILDDVAVLTKVAAKKTTGVLGDDLALNAQQVSGVAADRELPVVWAVAKGSALNKAILVPLALAISAFAPWAVTPLLMIGGAFLCFEGFEKLAHKFLHSQTEDDAHHKELTQALVNPEVDLVALRPARQAAVPAGAPERTSGLPADARGAKAGSLMVDSRPAGARVFVDGKLVGTTPLLLDSVDAGEHAVRLELDGFRVWTAGTKVTGGERARVSGSLEQR